MILFEIYHFFEYYLILDYISLSVIFIDEKKLENTNKILSIYE